MIRRSLLAVGLAALAACGSQKPTGTTDTPLGTDAGDPHDAGTLPTQLVFQPAFHQALRWSEPLAGQTTVRLRIPLGRAGERVRVTFKAGDSGMELVRASLARAGEAEGVLASPPLPLLFGGLEGFSVGPREQRTSDPVALPVGFREQLYVSLVASGSVAASAVELFPGGCWGAGDFADTSGSFGTPQLRALGVATVAVEAPASRVLVAMGDSITEGYVEGDDAYLEAWPAVAEGLLRLPVLNAGVSGQGVDGELENLESEILVLEGLTDCVVLLGTNDLGGTPVERIERSLDQLYDRLRPVCRIWAATLPPKQLEHVYEDRATLNAWIRAHPRVDGVIDFEAVLAEPDDPDRFREGLAMDHVHPSVKGHRAMGAEVARVIRADSAPAP